MTRPTGATGVGGVAAGSGMLAAACGTDAALALASRTLAETERDAEARRIAQAERRARFDLAQGPLLRARLLCLREGEHWLLLTMHHIATDGWSVGVLWRELAVLYAAFHAGQPSPLPALAGLDESGCVAYIGTFSKVLMPSLRVGYLVAPPPLRERIARLKRLTDYHTPWPLQRAMTTFIVEGHLERHIRRMRRHYGEKRAALHAALASVSDRAQLRGLDAGLHVFLELDAALDAEDIARRAARTLPSRIAA